MWSLLASKISGVAILATWMQNRSIMDSFVKINEQKSPSWYNSGSEW